MLKMSKVFEIEREIENTLTGFSLADKKKLMKLITSSYKEAVKQEMREEVKKQVGNLLYWIENK